MDTKLKNNKNKKYIITGIISLVFILIATGLVSSYSIIEESASNKQINPFVQGDFLQRLSNSNLAIYSDLINKKEEKDVNPSDYLVNNPNSQTGEEYGEYDKDGLNESIKRYKVELNNDLRNLEYYGIDTKTNTIEKYSTSNIEALLNDKLDEKTLKSLQDKYRFYAVLDFGEQGRISVISSHGASEKDIAGYLRNNEVATYNGYEINNIVNTKIVYAVPKDLKYTDDISRFIEYSSEITYLNTVSEFSMMVFIVVSISILLIPYRRLKELIGFNTVSKIPLEICIILAFMFLAFGVESSIVSNTLQGNMHTYLHGSIGSYILGSADNSIFIINIIYWFIIFYLLALAVTYIKYIFQIGIINYMKKNSLIYKFFIPIKNSVKSTIRYIGEIDLRNKNTKKIVLALGVNFIIIIAICSIWFFGFIFAAVYTVILYILAKKYLNKVSKDYESLLDVTNKIAGGNFDVKTTENLGIFEPLKEKIESIKIGFKKSVEEEVKSQKMKTELISNVSHDLKTPLTSIITYVDLLKDENLPIDKRNEYLDILDKKSQRLQYLIEDLFEVSKVTSGNVSLNIVDVDVVSLMKQTLLELDDKIENSSLIIRTNFPNDKVILSLDSQRTFRVFENLISNITKYAMKGSRVYVDIKDSDKCTEIVLKNMAGCEIDFRADEIIERFVRGDRARNTEGSGLGLSIAKSLVELQGGKFEIKIDGDLFKVIIKFHK